MTPQITPQPGTPVASLPGVGNLDSAHLSSDQIAELIALSTSGTASDFAANSAHLLACPTCAAEFAELRDALTVFRQASVAHADREFSHLQSSARPSFPLLPSHRAYPQALAWVAASAILMAAILPMELRWQRSLTAAPVIVTASAPRTAESDDALLADIDRELSASVPSPMELLADPTGTASNSEAYLPTSNSTPQQRKD